MNNNYKSYISKLVKESLDTFKREGYLTDLEELKEYVELILKNEKKKESMYLLDHIIKAFLDTDKYKEIKNNDVKMCCNCKKVLPISDYRIKNKETGIIASECKVCAVKYNREWRKNNPERTRELNMDYYHRSMLDDYKRQRYVDYRSKYKKKYPEKVNRDCRKQRLKKFLKDKLGRDITKDEIEKAFKIKEQDQIRNNQQVYEMLFK